MTKDEALAMDLALEALKSCSGVPHWPALQPAITAIKQARALDKMAENARELGLDYEPVAWMDSTENRADEAFRFAQTEDHTTPLYTNPPVQEPWEPHDTAYRPEGLPKDFIKHEVENEGDWSEWVNPKPEQYFMKCCDCGLVHEMQFKVAKYAEGDECEFVEDADLQAVFRARRATPPAAQPAPVQEPVAEVLEDMKGGGYVKWLSQDFFVPGTKLYTAAQRQWVEVEQIKWEGDKLIAKLKENT